MITLSPSDRLSVVGKTGSGKTTFSVVLACLLVDARAQGWQVWWLDSKLDPRDQAMLREWGFGRTPSRVHIPLLPKNGSVEEQAQWYCQKALRRKNVLVVVDEYKHCCKSTRRAGDGIEGVHLRGRGLNVGLLGQTQEPVDVPRQLLSQATHLFLFDLTYPADIKYARTLYEDYERPPDRRGFYHAHIDGDAHWRYYPHVKAWHDRITDAATQPA